MLISDLCPGAGTSWPHSFSLSQEQALQQALPLSEESGLIPISLPAAILTQPGQSECMGQLHFPETAVE